jgi:hypothetical protein
MLYVPLGVLAATVTIPLASMPMDLSLWRYIGIGWCRYIALTYHLSMRSMPLQPYCLMQQLPDRLLHLLDCLPQLWLSGITIAGVTFNLLMDWLA